MREDPSSAWKLGSRGSPWELAPTCRSCWVDHVEDLAQGRPDVPWNVTALCPNCHAPRPTARTGRSSDTSPQLQHAASTRRDSASAWQEAPVLRSREQAVHDGNGFQDRSVKRPCSLCP
ncbi:HNH endonuclease signature motif containing protein [Streptomyces sp. NPDC005248]|uniref:HNH endonuclease signature motif containing protein n=1 Tax=unclassified Streptomyces TaxID=2593676 RepID=UPI0036C808FC